MVVGYDLLLFSNIYTTFRNFRRGSALAAVALASLERGGFCFCFRSDEVGAWGNALHLFCLLFRVCFCGLCSFFSMLLIIAFEFRFVYSALFKVFFYLLVWVISLLGILYRSALLGNCFSVCSFASKKAANRELRDLRMGLMTDDVQLVSRKIKCLCWCFVCLG